MNLVKYIVVVFFSVASSLYAQTYVGEVLYGTSYQYVKVVVTDSLTTFTMPYVDNLTKYSVSENIKTSSNWKVTRDFESWQFNTSVVENQLRGSLLLKGTSQPVLFYQQIPGLPVSELSKYEGVFEDSNGNKAVVYAENGYLHLLSPYCKNTGHVILPASNATRSFSKSSFRGDPGTSV